MSMSRAKETYTKIREKFLAEKELSADELHLLIVGKRVFKDHELAVPGDSEYKGSLVMSEETKRVISK
jgi:cupin superfamily acireductone dioxygenase involved in methionine salvage